VRAYEGEKEEYDTFCEAQLKNNPEIDTPTSEAREEQEDLRKCKANKERFLAFTSKRHPENPAYVVEYIKNRS
jgi:hypothetical protein